MIVPPEDDLDIAPALTALEQGIDVIRTFQKTLPATPGVYRMLNARNDVLYIGKAKRLSHRVVAYTQPNRLPIRLQRMVSQTRHMEFVNTETEAAALLLECALIKNLQPRYNILLRDDKAFPYIALSKHTFPQLLKHRGARNEREAEYFGPFASAGMVSETLQILYRVFQLRNCSDNEFDSRQRPCLQYNIKRCTAPCVGRVNADEYAIQVKQARDFLRGKTSDVQKEMAQQMMVASEQRDYEKAQMFRDRIRALTAIQQRETYTGESSVLDADVLAIVNKDGHTAVQIFFFRQGRNYGTNSYFPSHEKEASLSDVLSAFIGQFYIDRPVPSLMLMNVLPSEHDLLCDALKTTMSIPQRGDKHDLVQMAVLNAEKAIDRHLIQHATQRKLLAGVAAIFGLAKAPERIEVYDNSHIQGHAAVGAMIVAGPEGFVKNQYRKFNIKDPSAAGDDFAMMREVMRRRFSKSETLPDLLLIDGGAGQISAVKDVLDEMGVAVPFVGIAKGVDRHAGREWFYQIDKVPFQLAIDDPVLFFLQRLRDEAHRFVIGTHRAKRDKLLVKNPLDELPGVGPQRRRALLHHFGSAKAVRDASLVDLERTPGISRSLAAKIHAFFHTK